VICHGSPPLRSTAALVFIITSSGMAAYDKPPHGRPVISFHITRFSSLKVSYIVSPEPGGTDYDQHRIGRA